MVAGRGPIERLYVIPQFRQRKTHYWGVSKETQFLHWLIDREYAQCRQAA